MVKYKSINLWIRINNWHWRTRKKINVERNSQISTDDNNTGLNTIRITCTITCKLHRDFIDGFQSNVSLENNLFESNDLTKKPNFQSDELKIGCKGSVERLRIIIAVFAGQQRPIPRNNPTYSTSESQESILIFEFRYSIFPYYVLSLSPLGYLLIQGWRRVHANFRVICSCSHESIRGKYYFVEENRGKGFFMCSFYFFFFGFLYIC